MIRIPLARRYVPGSQADPIHKPESAAASQASRSPAIAAEGDALVSRTYNYQVYGVAIRSDFETPHPQVSQRNKPQIVITRSESPLYSGPRKNPSAWFAQKTLRDGSVYLQWAGLFEFLISPDGTKISARELEHASPEAFATYLLGQVLSFALVKRGLDSLHASAVVVGDASIGFLGDCGSGKSTLVASFLLSGHKLMTDDLLLLQCLQRKIISYPGPPRLKLLPETSMLLPEPTLSVRMNPLVRKLVIPIDSTKCCAAAVPLKALYLLDTAPTSDRISISPLPPGRALLALIKNSFNVALTDAARLERQFNWAANIAAKIPVKVVSYPRNLAALPRLKAAILADLN